MKFLAVALLISVPIFYVFSNPAPSLSDSLGGETTIRIKRSVGDFFQRDKLIVFALLYAFFVVLSAFVALFYNYYSAKKKIATTIVEDPVQSENPERVSLIAGSLDSIAEIAPEQRRTNNEPEPTVECPKELLSCPIHEKMGYITYDQKFEIDKSNLKRGRLLGSGLSLHNYDPSEELIVYEELKLMCVIGKHPNVLSLIGAVTPKLGKVKQIMIVSEYIDRGDLLEFLQKRRDIFSDKLKYSEDGYERPKSSRQKLFGKKEETPIIEDSIDSLSTFDLLSFAYQIANGMEYLKNRQVVHRDLALRNILINSKKIIRIADFGLARQHKGKDYYIIQTDSKRLPIYYVAPESFDSLKFTEKSDIWSYGVCLFEIFSLGDKLYENVGDVMRYLKDGNRLQKPRYCHRDVYKFMELCWCIDPEARPRFSKCLSFFGSHLRQSAFDLLETIEQKLFDEARAQRELEEWTRIENDGKPEN
uniref:receptor protein-tyrosine kinase n=1 Tax=Caenorhabditis tropicalis TaxID=1561998 RepID=A0A1I7UCE2_9PELO